MWLILLIAFSCPSNKDINLAKHSYSHDVIEHRWYGGKDCRWYIDYTNGYGGPMIMVHPEGSYYDFGLYVMPKRGRVSAPEK